MRSFIKKRPATAYFTLTFIVSWIGIVAVSIFLGMPTTSTIFENYGPLALIPFLLGPMSVGLYATNVLYGKEGFKNLKRRLFNWKIKARWYLLAVLTIPAFIALWLLILNQFSDQFIPKFYFQEDKTTFVMTGILTGLIGGGFFEEMGWTGFAIPLLRKKWSVLRTGLTLGLIWGVWHFLPVYWGSGDEFGVISWSSFLPGLFSHYAVLIPFRVIQVWLHEKTNSMIPVMLFHSTLTSFALFLFGIVADGWACLIYYAGIAVFLWTIVFILYKKRQLGCRNSIWVKQ